MTTAPPRPIRRASLWPLPGIPTWLVAWEKAWVTTPGREASISYSAPGLNIYRAPMAGRNFEYLGEDPYLASRIVVP
jgi:hypothetical protein